MPYPILKSSWKMNKIKLSSSSVNISMPLGLVAGDTLLLVVFVQDGDNDTVHPPTGWIKLYEKVNSIWDGVFVFYKVASVDEATTQTITIDYGAYYSVIVARFEGVDSVEYATPVSGNSTSIQAPTLTHSKEAGREGLWLCLIMYENFSVYATLPANFPDNIGYLGTNGSPCVRGCTLNSTEKTVTPNQCTYSTSSGRWIANTLVLLAPPKASNSLFGFNF